MRALGRNLEHRFKNFLQTLSPDPFPFAVGETIIEDVDCVDTSYPGFEADLKRFQSKLITDSQTPVISSLPRPEDQPPGKPKRGKKDSGPPQFPL